MPALPTDDQVNLPWRECPRPRDTALVGVLLDRRGHDARRADPVGAHPDQLLVPVLVEVRRAERLGVARTELEDVADLDRRLDADRLAVDGVALLDAADVDDLELEVAPELHAAQVTVGTVGARDPAPAALLGDRPVQQHRHRRADGTDEAGRPDIALDLLWPGRPEGRSERVRELDVVDAVIAAQDE